MPMLQQFLSDPKHRRLQDVEWIRQFTSEAAGLGKPRPGLNRSSGRNDCRKKQKDIEEAENARDMQRYQQKGRKTRDQAETQPREQNVGRI